MTTKKYIAPFEEYDEKIQNYGNDYLKQIAVINVKKSGGKPSSDMDSIYAYAAFDKSQFIEQPELCDPTIIICGYTAYALEIITGQKFREQRNENLFYHIKLNGHDVYWYWTIGIRQITTLIL